MKRRIDHRVIRKQVVENNGVRVVIPFTERPRDEYVYIHRKETDNEVFYVGRGKRSRYKSTKRSSFWLKVARKHGCVVEIVAQGLHTHEAKLLELKLVEYYGRRNLGNGTLVNLTDGGDGAVNTVVSQETKYKLSLANTGMLNGNADLSSYHFRNYKTGETEYCTKWDFEVKHKINTAVMFSTERINTLKYWYAVCRMTPDQLERLENGFKGKYNKQSNLETYTFLNVDTMEEFTGNKHEFFEKYKTPVDHLFKKNRKCVNSTAHGWTVKELFTEVELEKIIQGKTLMSDEAKQKMIESVTGLNNPRADLTIYTFFNLLTDETISCTRFEMSKIVRSINWLFAEEGNFYVSDWCLIENKDKIMVPRGCGIRNGGKDYTKYLFKYKDGTELFCTRVQFKAQTNIDVKILFRSRTKTYKDWTVVIPE